MEDIDAMRTWVCACARGPGGMRGMAGEPRQTGNRCTWTSRAWTVGPVNPRPGSPCLSDVDHLVDQATPALSPKQREELIHPPPLSLSLSA